MSKYFEKVFGTMVNQRGTSWYKYEPGLIGLARGESGSISKSRLRSILKNPSNKDFIKKLVKEKVKILISVRDIGYNLSSIEKERTKEPYLFSDITKNIHFTFSQNKKLKKFLIRWDVHFPKRPLFPEIKDLKDAKSVLGYLESSLDSHILKWE